MPAETRSSAVSPTGAARTVSVATPDQLSFPTFDGGSRGPGPADPNRGQFRNGDGIGDQRQPEPRRTSRVALRDGITGSRRVHDGAIPRSVVTLAPAAHRIVLEEGQTL